MIGIGNRRSALQTTCWAWFWEFCRRWRPPITERASPPRAARLPALCVAIADRESWLPRARRLAAKHSQD